MTMQKLKCQTTIPPELMMGEANACKANNNKSINNAIPTKGKNTPTNKVRKLSN
jgi:hypothetical protein